MIISCQAHQYDCLANLNIKIHPLFQNLWAEPGWCNNSGGAEGEGAQCYVLELGLQCNIELYCTIPYNTLQQNIAMYCTIL